MSWWNFSPCSSLTAPGLAGKKSKCRSTKCKCQLELGAFTLCQYCPKVCEVWMIGGGGEWRGGPGIPELVMCEIIISNLNSYLIGIGGNFRRREKLKPGERTIMTGYKLTNSIAKPVRFDRADVNTYENNSVIWSNWLRFPRDYLLCPRLEHSVHCWTLDIKLISNIEPWYYQLRISQKRYVIEKFGCQICNQHPKIYKN